MKKYVSFMAFAMMIVVSLSLIACGDANDVIGSNELVGTWDALSATYYYTTVGRAEIETPDDAYWVFTADKLTVHDKKDLMNGKSVSYTYDSKTKELSIIGYPLYTVTELSGSTLVIRSEEIYGVFNVVKFKKR